MKYGIKSVPEPASEKKTGNSPQRLNCQSEQPNYYIGIDLGTTNSVMGWGTLNPQTNQLETKVVEIKMMLERMGTGKKHCYLRVSISRREVSQLSVSMPKR